jgi:DNA polymerase (family X)
MDHMARMNDAVASLLREYAELLAITGGDPFRARNYEKAAKVVGGYPGDIDGLGEAALVKIPGVGKSIAGKIAEYQATGGISAVEELRGAVPPGVRELTRVPGLGPKRAMQLTRELGIASVAELEEAVSQGRLRNLAGFGPKSEERILRGLAVMTADRVLLSTAMDVATTVIAALEPLAGRIEYAGSLRRMRETIGDVDILATAADAEAAARLMSAFRELAGAGTDPDNSKRRPPGGGPGAGPAGGGPGAGPAAREPEAGPAAREPEAGPAGQEPEAGPGVIVSGPTKTSVRVSAGPGGQTLQVDLRVVQPAAFGAALQYFTGSQAHNVAVRQIAVRKGLKLSEYGLFRMAGGTAGGEADELIVSATEEEVYQALGLQWVPPPMREDTGEVEAAKRNEVPAVVAQEDLRGDLHTHTNLTDGVATLAEMIEAAERRGYAYYAVTDHAPNLFMQRMTDEKVLAQREEIDALRARTPMALLHGSELNIAPDGSVDWPEDFLAGFDMCVASVHSHFDAGRKEMTSRFITACENPRVNVIGHPLTRKIGRRPPVDVDLPELFRACARTGTALEINASPARLDLPADHVKAARDAGVKFSIDTDAHSVGDLSNVPYGIGTAQRGWLAPDDVINTWPLDRLLAFFAKR